MRPKPTILESYTDPKTFVAEQVLGAAGVFSVLYDGQPINIRTVRTLLDVANKKYDRSSFASLAPARNMAKRLNELYRTEKFAVHRMTIGAKL